MDNRQKSYLLFTITFIHFHVNSNCGLMLLGIEQLNNEDPVVVTA